MLRRAAMRTWASIRMRQLLSCGRCDEAIDLCRGLLGELPDDSRLLFLLGKAYFRSKSYASAFFCLSSAAHRAGARRRRLPAALDYYRGVSAYRLGRLDACIESLERFRASVGRLERHLTPTAPLVKACVFLGYARVKQGQVEQAIEVFEQVLRCGGEDTAVVVDLAALYCRERVGRAADAVRVLKEALDRCPDDVELLKGLSHAYGLLQDHPQAMRYALRSLKLRPDDRWTHRQLAFLHTRRSRHGALHLHLVERIEEPVAGAREIVLTNLATDLD